MLKDWRAVQKQLKVIWNRYIKRRITPILYDMYMKVGERFISTNTNCFLTFRKEFVFDAFKIWWIITLIQFLEKVTRINETTLSELLNSLGDLIPNHGV